jgi:hypothetical protein
MGFPFRSKLDDASYANGLFERERWTGRELWRNDEATRWSERFLKILKPFSDVIVISFKLHFKIPLSDSEP